MRNKLLVYFGAAGVSVATLAAILKAGLVLGKKTSI